MFILKNIRLLTIFNFLYCFRLYTAIAIIYFTEVTESYALGISIFSIMQLTQAIFEVPTGIFSDMIGRKRSLQLGSIAMVGSIVCFTIGQWYFVLAVGALLQGICNALFSGNNDAMLYESLAQINRQETYHEHLGKIHSWLELAGFVSAIVGGLIAFVAPLQVLMGISVLPQIGAFISTFFLDEPIHQREKVGNVFSHLLEAFTLFRKNMRLRTMSVASILSDGIGGASWSFQSAFYHTVLPVWAVSFVISLNYLASTISFRLSGRIISRFKALNVLIFQEVYSRILYSVALLIPTFISPFLMAGASVLYGPGMVAMNTLMQKEFSDHQRATMASINALCGSIFFAIVAVGIGAIADRFGAATALLVGQICLIPVFFLYLNLFLHEKKQ